ncbi:MAG: glycosyltransferase family 9 protein [candidate division WOR-3 bacterium]
MPLKDKLVLVIQSTRYLGDFLLSLPVARALLDGGARPVFLSHEKFRELFALSGLNAIYWDKDGNERGLRGMRVVVKRIKSTRPDAAVMLHKSHRSALVAFSAGIPERVGFSDSPARALYTKRFPYEQGLHETVRFQRLLLPLGLEEGLVREEMWFPERGKLLEAARPVAPKEPFVLIAPGSSWRVKRWSPGNFAEVAERFLGKGFRVILSGGKADRGVSAEVADKAKGVADLAGRLSFPEFLGLVGLASLVVSGDSAPVHAAGIFGTPCIAIYGPTVREMGFWPLSPRSKIVEVPLRCRPCKARAERPCPLGHHDCMAKITPDMVIRAAEDLL